MRPLLLIGAGLAVLSWALGAPAATLEPAAGAHVPAIASALPPPEPEQPGATCTPWGCLGGHSSPWNALVGFGAAALAAGWIGRRQQPRPQ